jgi:hypothetical protein
MNLYLICNTDKLEYDTYDSAVVAAENVLQAQGMHPSENDDNETGYGRSWCHYQNVKVELIGKAKAGTKAGVICASFNAG